MTAASLPTGSTGRALAIGLVLLALALAWTGIATPLLDLHARRADELAQMQRRVQRMELLAASLPRWQAAQRNRTDEPVRTVLLDGASDSVAAAGLQGLITDLATQAGTVVTSMEAINPEPRGPYRRIGIRVTADGQWPALLDMLHRMESGTPTLVVDELNIRGPDVTTRADSPPLASSFLVVGYRPATTTERP